MVQALSTLRRGRRWSSPIEHRTGCIRGLSTDKLPEQLKLSFALWTRHAVADLIETQYGVRLSIRTVGDYLARWGMTPQKPAKPAYEQC